MTTTSQATSPPPERLRWPLSTRMTLTFVVTIIIPAIVLGVLLFNYQRQQRLTEVQNHVATLGRLKAEEIDLAATQLEGIAKQLVLESEDTVVYFQALDRDATPEDIAAAEQALERLWTDRTSIVFVRLVSTQPDVIASQGLSNITPNRQTQGDLARNVTETLISAIYAGPGGEPLVDVVVPMRNLVGQVQGHFVITQDLSRTPRQATLESLPDLYTALRAQPLIDNMPQADAFLYQYDGMLIGATTNRTQLFNPGFAEAEPLERTAALSPRSINRYGIALRDLENDVSEYTSPVTGQEVIGYYTRIAGTRWTVAVEIPADEAMAATTRQFLPVMLLLVGVIILFNMMVYLVGYRNIVPPLQNLMYQMNTFSLQSPTNLSPVQRQDEIGLLQRAFQRLVGYAREEYEDSSSARDRYQRHLGLLFDLQSVFGVQDMDFILSETARLIRERYDKVDYVQILMINSLRQVAVVRAGTGELGRRLVVREHEQPLGEGGIISNTVQTDGPVLVNNVSGSIEYSLSQVFEQTLSVLAVPIRAHNETLGVLDIHSYARGAFTQEDIDYFSALGLALGVALLGTRQSAVITPTAGPDSVSTQRTRVTELAAVAGSSTLPQDWTPLQQEAIRTRRIARQAVDGNIHFALPIELRREVLGAVEWVVEEKQFNSELVETAIDLVRRLALAIDNAQLFEQSRRLIERERRVNEITQKITAQNDIEQILQVAVRELGQALGTADTIIKLNIDRE